MNTIFYLPKFLPRGKKSFKQLIKLATPEFFGNLMPLLFLW